MKLSLLLLIFGIFTASLLPAQCWKQIKFSKGTAIAINIDGSLWTWGSNEDGKLGIDSSSHFYKISTPVQVGSDNDWDQIDAGWDVILVLKNNGTLWSWGDNAQGQVGNNSVNQVLSPIQVGMESDWAKVIAGTFTAYAIKKDNTLWAWGNNSHGSYGDGTTWDYKIPHLIGSFDQWMQIKCGNYHAAGIKIDSSLWTWGSNEFGELGLGQPAIYRKSPFQIAPGTAWKYVEAGIGYTMAIRNDGTLWGFGRNENGQLGDSVLTNKYEPIQIGKETNWSKVYLGGWRHTIGLKTDGTLWAWGNNISGQLGNGTTIPSSNPIQVGTANDWANADVGYGTNVARNSRGEYYAWGHNLEGSVGNGNFNNQLAPVLLNCDLVKTSELTNGTFNIFPNPTADNIRIETNGISLSNVELEIRDVLGRIVFKNIYLNRITPISVHHFESGMYILTIKNTKSQYSSLFYKI
jgi:alpha-tubulin suppressor-like RCC1 family protein